MTLTHISVQLSPSWASFILKSLSSKTSDLPSIPTSSTPSLCLVLCIAISWRKNLKVYILGTPFITKSYHLAFPVAPHCQYHFQCNPDSEMFSWLISLHTILSEARLFVLAKYSPEVQSTPLPMTFQTSQLDKQNFPPSPFQDDKYDIPLYLGVYISQTKEIILIFHFLLFLICSTPQECLPDISHAISAPWLIELGNLLHFDTCN